MRMEQFRKYLSQAGVLDAYTSLPSHVQDRIHGRLRPPYDIRLAQFLHKDQMAKAIHKHIQKVGKTHMVDTPTGPISHNDIFQLMTFMGVSFTDQTWQRVHHTQWDNIEPLKKVVSGISSAFFKPDVDPVDISHEFIHKMYDVINRASDPRAIYYQFDNMGERLILTGTPVQSKHIYFKGHSHTCYQVNRAGDVNEAIQHNNKPVWIEEHAIRRVLERLHECNWVFNDVAYCVHDWTPITYRDQMFLPHKSDRRMLTGYFPVIDTPDGYVLTTFLFVTMDGTPEGDKLSKRLKVDRTDKEYLNLDNYDAAALAKDPTLAKIMCDAGLGDLVTLGGMMSECHHVDPTYVKKYLRIA